LTTDHPLSIQGTSPNLNVISVHNRYLLRGGEDEVFESEASLLTQYGWQVTPVVEQNVYPDSVFKKIGVAMDCVWSRHWYREFSALLQRTKPDVVHIHNFFPLISPSVYYACRKAGVPVVQTLHNYRLLCPAATLYRDGNVCEECLQHGLLRGVKYGCYQGSKLGTSAIALMLQVHRRLRTWAKMVDCYIALTEFSRRKLIDGGLPAAKIRVKPNFVLPDPGMRERRGRYALFAGRLVDPKGLPTLLAAWKLLRKPIPLVVIGDGPNRAALESQLKEAGLRDVIYRGRLSHEDTVEAIKGARFLVFPSEWYEGFPVTIAESFACGVPVICSRLGSMQEIVADGRTGLHFRPTEADDLASKIEWAWDHPEQMEAMGRGARFEFEAKYTAERNFYLLKEIYEFAMGARSDSARREEPEAVLV
jgi:glycosyltransferase involved in cell wall biosynthesis